MAFKNLFVKENETSNKNEVNINENKNVESTKVNSTPSPTITPTNIGANGVVDTKFVDMLMQVIAENNLPGMDYFELKQSINTMSNLPIDENNKFLSAFAVLSSQGCTKESLLTSLDKYITLVQNERTNFDKELESQYNEKVKNKQELVNKAKEELDELNRKIRETNELIITTSQEIQQEEGNLQIIAANFNKSVQLVLNNLEEDKNKINNLIK